MSKRVLAAAAHPDDIEFMMSGTLLLLRQAGYEIHYLNIGNGDRGSAVYDRAETARIRRQEAMTSAASIGAVFHDSLCSDLEILYTPELLAKAAAVIREIEPEILLVQSTVDYMEDHTNAVRLGVSAAFCRGMMNLISDPPRPAVNGDITVYHALPHGLHDPLRHLVQPEFFIDVTTEMKTKRDMLACHRSQKEWLDASQGMDSYLLEMEKETAQCGKMSGRFAHAEGWTRHWHLGFCAPDADPLGRALADKLVLNPRWSTGD